MPTFVQRASAIADAILNAQATPEQRQRLIEAFAPRGLDTPPAPQESARALVASVRAHVLSYVRKREAPNIDADFAESP